MGLVSAVTSAVTMGYGTSVILFHMSNYMFYVAMSVGLVGTLVAGCVFGPGLVNVQRRLLSKEATMRFGLMRVREHAESIAFFHGEQFEHQQCISFFDDVVGFMYRKLAFTVSLQAFNTCMQIGVMALPMFVLAPAYFRGEVDFGSINQAHMLFAMLWMSLSTLMVQLDGITNLGAQAIRITQLQDALAGMRPRQNEEAFLDEATSALDAHNEDVLYRLLGERIPCYVSVGHRPTLDKYHTCQCILVPGADCVVTNIAQ